MDNLSHNPEVLSFSAKSLHSNVVVKCEEISRLIHVSEFDSYPLNLEQLQETIHLLQRVYQEIKQKFDSTNFAKPEFERETYSPDPKIYVGSLHVHSDTPKDVWYYEQHKRTFFCVRRIISDDLWVWVVIENEKFLGFEISQNDFVPEFSEDE